MMELTPILFIVDDDAKFRKSLARLLKSAGYTVEAFGFARDFLKKELPANPCCLLLDVRMPELTGPDLQRELAARNILLPIIFLTALADVPTSVDAMKEGAVDFLLKPIEEKKLFKAIEVALEHGKEIREKDKGSRRVKSLVASLTPREHEVLQWLITGRLNKQIAGETNITERTVKAHRSQVMKKLHVDSIADLVRLAEEAGVKPRKEPAV